MADTETKSETTRLWRSCGLRPDEDETAEQVGGDTGMQRRIKAQPQETVAYQALIDHKQATLERDSLADS